MQRHTTSLLLVTSLSLILALTTCIYVTSLSLSLSLSQISLDYCLQGYMHSELVSNVDCIFCTKNCSTKEKRNFVKQLRIGRLPLCLTLHIMRTVWLPDGLLSKNHTHMEFPLSLDLTKYTAHTDQNRFVLLSTCFVSFLTTNVQSRSKPLMYSVFPNH